MARLDHDDSLGSNTSSLPLDLSLRLRDSLVLDADHTPDHMARERTTSLSGTEEPICGVCSDEQYLAGRKS